MDTKMFCFQCQETAGCKGCTVRGVCGKTAEVAGLQDLLVYVTKGLAAVATAVRGAGGKVGLDVNHMVTTNLFTTITNANFDPQAISARVQQTLAAKRELLAHVPDQQKLPQAALWDGPEGEFAAKAPSV
ncbi:MAG: hydroxylamine reductase, partial [Atopobium sp.]|nr:hydroxylamine reductase [Atopobium sp.]